MIKITLKQVNKRVHLEAKINNNEWFVGFSIRLGIVLKEMKDTHVQLLSQSITNNSSHYVIHHTDTSTLIDVLNKQFNPDILKITVL